MDKITRRTATITVTITITESWTIVWSPADDPLPSARAMVQANPNPQEETDERLQASVIDVELADPKVSESTAASMTTKPSAGQQRKRPRHRRSGDKQRSKF